MLQQGPSWIFGGDRAAAQLRVPNSRQPSKATTLIPSSLGKKVEDAGRVIAPQISRAAQVAQYCPGFVVQMSRCVT
jgi:hypothetical protein